MKSKEKKENRMEGKGTKNDSDDSAGKRSCISSHFAF